MTYVHFSDNHFQHERVQRRKKYLWNGDEASEIMEAKDREKVESRHGSVAKRVRIV